MWDLGCISEAAAVGCGRRDDVIPRDEPGSLAPSPWMEEHWHTLPTGYFLLAARFTTAGGLCSSELLMAQNAGDSPDFPCRWLATAPAQFKEATTNQSWRDDGKIQLCLLSGHG